MEDKLTKEERGQVFAEQLRRDSAILRAVFELIDEMVEAKKSLVWKGAAVEDDPYNRGIGHGLERLHKKIIAEANEYEKDENRKEDKKEGDK